MFEPNGSLKTHVVLATYEALQGNGAVFRRVPRWDCLVVDEGQRLKGGKASQLYSVIDTLRIGHRVILSGTLAHLRHSYPLRIDALLVLHRDSPQQQLARA
jgi:SNF2 family DNA or RNA helicase